MTNTPSSPDHRRETGRIVRISRVEEAAIREEEDKVDGSLRGPLGYYGELARPAPVSLPQVDPIGTVLGKTAVVGEDRPATPQYAPESGAAVLAFPDRTQAALASESMQHEAFGEKSADVIPVNRLAAIRQELKGIYDGTSGVSEEDGYAQEAA